MSAAGPAQDAQLRALYEAAAVFVFPSLYEGFEHPAAGSHALAASAQWWLPMPPRSLRCAATRRLFRSDRSRRDDGGDHRKCAATRPDAPRWIPCGSGPCPRLFRGTMPPSACARRWPSSGSSNADHLEDVHHEIHPPRSLVDRDSPPARRRGPRSRGVPPTRCVPTIRTCTTPTARCALYVGGVVRQAALHLDGAGASSPSWWRTAEEANTTSCMCTCPTHGQCGPQARRCSRPAFVLQRWQ